LAHEASFLAPPLFIAMPVPSLESERLCTYMFVRDLDRFLAVLTVWYFVYTFCIFVIWEMFVIVYCIQKLDKLILL
jgi:hypothetical protein